MENFGWAALRKNHAVLNSGLVLMSGIRDMLLSRQLSVRLLVLVTLSFLASGAHSQTPAAPGTTDAVAPASAQEKSASAATDSSLRLGAGDLLQFGVYNVPELATRTRVASNGDIYLPLIDYVHVAGLTVEEAQNLIEKKFSDGGFLKDPHVTLFVDQFASQGVSLLGEVAKPGVYPVLGEQRLFDLISAAGGLTEKAGRSVTVTRRKQPDKPIVLELARNIADSPDRNVEIYPGDTIIVRRADIVYVVGDVARPAGFLMDRGSLTVLQAVALAGGTTHTSKLNGAKIIRKTDSGMTETPIELSKILHAKAADLPMQADDILFIPTSTGKLIGRRGIDTVVQMATAVSIVAIR